MFYIEDKIGCNLLFPPSTISFSLALIVFRAGISDDSVISLLKILQSGAIIDFSLGQVGSEKPYFFASSLLKETHHKLFIESH